MQSTPRRHIIASLLLLPLSAAARDENALWSRLKAGGQVLLIRHAVTTPGAGDPPGFRLADCSTQRNLTEEGRQQARTLGAAFRTRGIAIGRVLSSPWCRCTDTAQLAFGSAQVSPALANLFGRSESREAQVSALKSIVVGWRGPGNLALVTHGSTISALTGVAPDTAEVVVATPAGDGSFVVAGRLVVAR